jgi:N-acetylglucosamine-6-phosphate deacetylase
VFAIRGKLLLGGEFVAGAVVVDGARIRAVTKSIEEGSLPAEIIDAEIVAPGFVDLQVNGAFGAEVSEDPEALRRLARELPRTGVTALLPTLVSSPADMYPRVFAAFEAARGGSGAELLGLHLEGPYLAPARAGAHRREVIAAADALPVEALLEPGYARLVTLAPERRGAIARIEAIRARGAVVSLGHTQATFEEFTRGVDAGATMATHLYNAMSPFEHRAPGAVGAALTDPRITVGLIVDGVHCHDAAVRLALTAKGEARTALVTDAMPAAGMPPGAYALGGQRVHVDERSARLACGTLAGSILTMDAAVRGAIRAAGASVTAALRMASEVPARLLGRDDKGALRAGADADLVLLDAGLAVEATLARGAWAYRRAARAVR